MLQYWVVSYKELALCLQLVRSTKFKTKFENQFMLPGYLEMCARVTVVKENIGTLTIGERYFLIFIIKIFSNK